MKNIIKRLLSCVIVCAMTIAVLSGATGIAERKTSDFKYAPFFEHAKDIDVLFFGSSHMLNAIYPMELWNRYGITSYNFGGHGCAIASSYWYLMNALDYCSPKTVVVDCLFLNKQRKASENFSYQHLSLDAFPLSLTKIRTVFDLMNDPNSYFKEEPEEESKEIAYEKPTAIGLLWHYSVYHSRWTELTKEDFAKSSTHEYGAEARVRVNQPDQVIENKGERIEENTTGMKYLRKIIEECRKRNIDIVLTYMPFPISKTTNWKEVNTAQDIADEYGIDYINFPEEDVVDFDVDCYDEGSHLNVSGALKVTNYLGNYLTENYGLTDHREDPEYAYWDKDYTVYKRDKDERLNAAADLNTFLMLLNDDDYGFILNIGDPRIFEDETTMSLLRNKGVNVDEIGPGTKCIIAYGNDTRVINSATEEKRNYGELIPFTLDDRSGVIDKMDEDYLILDNNKLYQEERIFANVYNSDGTGMVNSSVFAIPATSTSIDRTPEQGHIVLKSRAQRVG